MTAESIQNKAPNWPAIAESIAQQIGNSSLEIEQAAELPAELVNSLRTSGLNRMAWPAKYGGYQACANDYIETVQRIAQADAASAWCVFIGITASMSLAWLPEATAKRLTENPELLMSGVFAPRGRALQQPAKHVVGAIAEPASQWLVSGQWAWSSASRIADYVINGVMLCDYDGKLLTNADGSPEQRVALLPASALQDLDSWQVLGLVATGSTDCRAENYAVDDNALADLVNGQPVDEPLYRYPLFGYLAAGIAAVILGTAERSVQEFYQLAAVKRPEGARKTLANRAVIQADVARSVARIRAAKSWLLSVSDQCMQAAEQGQVALQQRSELRMACTQAAEAGLACVQTMFKLAGGSSVYQSCLLQKLLRDAQVARQHMMVSDSTWELTGQVLLGVEADFRLL